MFGFDVYWKLATNSTWASTGDDVVVGVAIDFDVAAVVVDFAVLFNIGSDALSVSVRVLLLPLPPPELITSLTCFGALTADLMYTVLSPSLLSTLLFDSFFGRSVVVTVLLVRTAMPLTRSDLLLSLFNDVVEGRTVVRRCFQFLPFAFLPLVLPFLRFDDCDAFDCDDFCCCCCCCCWCCCCCCLRFPLAPLPFVTFAAWLLATNVLCNVFNGISGTETGSLLSIGCFDP